MARIEISDETIAGNPGIDPEALRRLKKQQKELRRLGVLDEPSYKLEPALGGRFVRGPRPNPHDSSRQLKVETFPVEPNDKSRVSQSKGG